MRYRFWIIAKQVCAWIGSTRAFFCTYKSASRKLDKNLMFSVDRSRAMNVVSILRVWAFDKAAANSLASASSPRSRSIIDKVC